MKKLFSIILAFSLSLSLCSFARAANIAPSAVSVVGNLGFTQKTRTTDAATVSGLWQIATNSKMVLIKPANLADVATLTFEFGAGKIETRTVYKDPKNVLYITSDKSYRKIDAATFYNLADLAGIGFYKYRPIPTAKVENTNLTITDSTYQFKKIDDQFYKTQRADGGSAIPSLTANAIPVPTFSIEPKDVKISVTLDNESVWSGKLEEIASFKPTKSGNYNLKYLATFDNAYYNGNVTYIYGLLYVMPSTKISFSVDNPSVDVGELLVLRAKNIPQDGKIQVTTNIEFKPNFFRQANGDMVAFLPISTYSSAGNYNLQLKCGDSVEKFAIVAKNKKFVVQNLTVPPSTAQATINSQAANSEYEKYIAPIRPISDNKQYWDGRFKWPLAKLYPRSTEFGTMRYTNGSKTPSRHNAIDFAAPANTPVFASAAGRVLYSGNLKLTGNTIVIEHGYGLKTWHYHLNGRNVQTGDMVKQGQQIGIVGSTGFSTGAHLHFSMSINDTFINPETAITTDLLSSIKN